MHSGRDQFRAAAGRHLALVAFALPVVGAAATAESDSGTLEVVIVTAEKHATDVQKTPIPINVVTGAEALAEGKTRIDEIIEAVPGVQIQGDLRGPRFIIRGLTNNISTTAASPTATYVDGVYRPQPVAQQVGLLDVDRVEVLKGPQGTLYGANSLGGTINTVSNDPVIGAWDWSGNVDLGNYNARRVEAMANLPLGSIVAVRFAAVVTDRDGYLSDGSMDSKIKAGRVKVLVQPSEKLRLLLAFDGARVTGAGFGSTYWDSAQYRSWDNVPDPLQTTNPGGNNGNTRLSTGSARLDWTTHLGTLTATAAVASQHEENYFYNRQPGSAVVNNNHDLRSEPTREIEARFSSPTGSRVQWTGGLFYMYQDDPVKLIINPFVSFGEQSAEKRTKAAYVQTRAALTGKLRVNLGARYSRDDRNDVLLPSPFGPGASADSNYTRTTWLAGLEYDLGQSAMLYGGASTGYRAGGFFPPFNAPKPPAFPESALTAYEVGMKSRYLEQRLQVNADVYLYDWENYQLESADTVTSPGCQVTNTCALMALSASNAKNKGAELEVDYRVTPLDRLNANFTMSEAALGALPDTLVTDPTVDVGNPADAGKQPYVPASQYYNNLQQDHAPKWSWAVGYERLFHLAGGGTIRAGINTRQQGGYWLRWHEGMGQNQATPDYRLWQRQYSSTSLNVGYTSADEKWTVSAYSRNLENYVVPQAMDITAHSPIMTVYPSSPRTFGVVIAVRR